MVRFFLFGTIFLLVLGAVNYYTYRRFFYRLSPSFQQYAWFIPALLMFGEVVFILDVVLSLIPDSPTVYMVSSAFIGISFMLFVVATIYDLSITVSSKVPFDESRRRFIKIIFDVTMIVAAIAYLFRGLTQGAKAPVINTIPVKVKDFPFEKFTIVQLTDIHVGRTIRRSFVEDLIRRTNEMQPDLVVITGDLVDLPVERIRDDLEPFKELVAPSYFITGNHEYFHGAESVIQHVRKLGIIPLLNESVMIEKGNSGFNLIGLTDLIGERIGVLPIDVEKAYSGVDISRPCIVLSHQPKSLFRVKDHRCDLMISGHTHGGQIFPFGLLVMIDQPYLAGLHSHGSNRQIFVSRGAGYWGPPIRVLAPSEISRLIIESV